jgi:hypothetical protein
MPLLRHAKRYREPQHSSAGNGPFKFIFGLGFAHRMFDDHDVFKGPLEEQVRFKKR